MSPYIVYGFGIHPKDVSKTDLDILSNINDKFKSKTFFYWFYEDGAGSDNEGIYYLISSNPYNKDRDKHPWHVDFETMEKFKNDHVHMVADFLKEHNILHLKDKVKFYSSCWEI